MTVTTKNGKQPRIYVAGPWAFLAVSRKGRNSALLYLKVPACVVYVGCYCGAAVGERCVGDHGPTNTCHVGRAKAARALLRRCPNKKITNLGTVCVV